jgi:integral membrane protein (TIGR00529 family)
MKNSGQIDDLINNVRISRRYLLPFSAALMGLLPMPGGALLSAPILEKGGEGVPNDLKAAINNWFRHLLIFVYPLSPALIVATQISNLDIYYAILYLLPGLILAIFLGYVFYLRHVEGKIDYKESFSKRQLIIPLIIILCAPALDFSLKRSLQLDSWATLIGVSVALILSITLSKKKLNLRDIILKMKPWNFSMIILGMFLYLHIFQASDASDLIAGLPLPPLMLAVTAGFVLSVCTGRVQLPASIVLPVYLSSVPVITPTIFALIYIAIFFGYIISPVHPCLVVTCEYFGISIKEMIIKLAIPTGIMTMLVVLAAIIIH